VAVRDYIQENLTIAISTTTSGALTIKEYGRGGFTIPAAFTGATVTFHVSDDGTTYAAVRDDAGSAVAAVTVAASGIYNFPDAVFKHAFVKIVSASSEAAARTIKCFIKA